MKSVILFVVYKIKLIIRMTLLTVLNLSGLVKISVMEIVICGTKNNCYHPPESLLLYLADHVQKCLVYDMQSVRGLILKQSSQT